MNSRSPIILYCGTSFVWYQLTVCRVHISRVSDQNGVSLLYIMLEIHHSGWEPSIYTVACLKGIIEKKKKKDGRLAI